MSAPVRAAIVVAGLAVALVAFSLLRPDTAEPPSPPSATERAVDQQHERPETTTSPRRPSPSVPTIRVRDGEPVGGVRRLEARAGERVRFAVATDVADHVHVHGYDLMRDVAPGRPARFSFPARLEGVFEVELENRGLQVAELRVRPQ